MKCTVQTLRTSRESYLLHKMPKNWYIGKFFYGIYCKRGGALVCAHACAVAFVLSVCNG